MAGNSGEDCSLNGNVNGNVKMMSSKREMEKEKSRVRERKRRSITTKILDGLRKHGGYNLSPRADINDVLRALAQEAGWVVEPDGTTYRQPSKDHCLECRHVSSDPCSDFRMYEGEGNNGMPAHSCLAPCGPHLAMSSGPMLYAPPCPYPYQ